MESILTKMRKRTKIKSHSCALCKPHKMGCSNRWKAKDLAMLKMFEKIKSLKFSAKLAEIDI